MSKSRVLPAVVLLAASSSLAVAILEVAGRNMLRYAVATIQEPDHRLHPNGPQTNADGIRSKVDPNTVRSEDLNIVFLGDSFVYGSRMPPEHAIPQLLETEARDALPGRAIHVFNFGWPSSSPLLSLRLLRDVGAHYKPDVVLLMVDVTDYHDEVKYRRMFDRRGIWALAGPMPVTLLGLSRVAWLVPSVYESAFGVPGDRFFIVNQPLAKSRPLLDPILESIDAIAAHVRDTLHAKLLVVQNVRAFQYTDRESPESWENDDYQPMGPYVRAPFEFLGPELEKRNIPYLSLLPVFESSKTNPLYLNDDPHWNEAGGRLAAHAVFEYCKARGCFDDSL